MFWEVKRSTPWNHSLCVCMKRKKKNILISHSPWMMFTDIWPRGLGSQVQVRCQIRVRLVDRRGSHRVCRRVRFKKQICRAQKIGLKKWAECSVCQEIIKSWRSKHLYDVTQLQYNTSALRSASLRTSRFCCLGLFVSTACVFESAPCGCDPSGGIFCFSSFTHLDEQKSQRHLTKYCKPAEQHDGQK